MRKYLLPLLVFFAVTLRAEKIEWLTDLPSGLKLAQAQEKTIFLLFAGDDVFTRKLRTEILEQPEFIAFAKTNLISVEIDLSSTNQLPAEVRAANEAVAAEFEVQQIPLVFLLDANGTKLEKGGYVEGGAAKYIELIKRVPGFRLKETATQIVQSNAPDQLLSPPAPAVTYDELTLRGISRGRETLALINDKNLAKGESARVKLGDGRVKVECREIREQSVIVQVENEPDPRELILKTPSLK